MNKSELIDAIASKSGLSKVDAGKALSALAETVASAIASGDKVTITGFGTFKGSQRAARKGTNPKTGKPLDIAAHTVVSFKAGSDLKGAL